MSLRDFPANVSVIAARVGARRHLSGELKKPG